MSQDSVMQVSNETRVKHIISEEAWKEYEARGCGGGQTHQRILDRGGFSAMEIITLLYARLKRIEGKPVDYMDLFPRPLRAERGTGAKQ